MIRSPSRMLARSCYLEIPVRLPQRMRIAGKKLQTFTMHQVHFIHSPSGSTSLRIGFTSLAFSVVSSSTMSLPLAYAVQVSAVPPPRVGVYELEQAEIPKMLSATNVAYSINSK